MARRGYEALEVQSLVEGFFPEGRFGQYQDLAESFEHFSDSKLAPIKSFFELQVKHVQVKHVRTEEKDEPITKIQLQQWHCLLVSPSGSNLQDSVHTFGKSERNRGINNELFTEEYSIIGAPEVLLVRLKRDFEKVSKSPDRTPIDLSENLLLPVENVDGSNSSIGYKLHSFIVYHSQHYYSFIKTSENAWKKFDDGVVEDAKLSNSFRMKLIKESGYMYFYIRNDAINSLIKDEVKVMVSQRMKDLAKLREQEIYFNITIVEKENQNNDPVYKQQLEQFNRLETEKKPLMASAFPKDYFKNKDIPMGNCFLFS